MALLTRFGNLVSTWLLESSQLFHTPFRVPEVDSKFESNTGEQERTNLNTEEEKGFSSLREESFSHGLRVELRKP